MGSGPVVNRFTATVLAKKIISRPGPRDATVLQERRQRRPPVISRGRSFPTQVSTTSFNPGASTS
jgi:hypothetical protein